MQTTPVFPPAILPCEKRNNSCQNAFFRFKMKDKLHFLRCIEVNYFKIYTILENRFAKQPQRSFPAWISS
jgi:hypothetical protein